MRISITGGTGFIGRHLVESLIETDHDIRLIVHRKRPIIPPGGRIETVKGDVHDVDSLIDAFDSTDIVYHLVGIIAETRQLTFEKTVVSGTENVAAACRKNSVNKIIYLSALGTSPSALSKYHQSKWKAEEAIRNSGIDYTIFRPSVIFGRGDGFVSMLTGMIKRLPLIPVIGRGDFQLQPIYIRDLVYLLRDTLENEMALNKTIEIGGPDRISYKDILSILKRILNKKRGNLYLPVWFMRLNAFILERIMKRSPITTDQLKMLQAGSTCNNNRLHEIFNVRLTSFEKGLLEYMR